MPEAPAPTGKQPQAIGQDLKLTLDWTGAKTTKTQVPQGKSATGHITRLDLDRGQVQWHHETRDRTWTRQGTRHMVTPPPTPMKFTDLPPYDPATSNLPPLPTTPVDGETLMRRYGISKAGFHNRKQGLPSIEGIRRGKRVYFPPSEVYLLDATHWYLETGYTLGEVQEALRGFDASTIDIGIEDAPIEVEETPPQQPTGGIQATPESTLAVSPAAAQLSRDLGLLIVKAVEAVVPKDKDPLRIHRNLTEASEKQYLMTNRMAAECAGMSIDTIRRWGETHQIHGFEFKRVWGRQKWKVRKMTEEEIDAA